MKGNPVKAAIPLIIAFSYQAKERKIENYHKDWIDINNNNSKDVFEDRSSPTDQREEDLLSQMTVEEKTAQTATLYGYGRVLRDELPTFRMEKRSLERWNSKY